MEINFKYLTKASIVFDEFSSLKEEDHFVLFCDYFVKWFKGIDALSEKIRISSSCTIDLGFIDHIHKKNKSNHYYIESVSFVRQLELIARALYLSEEFKWTFSFDTYEVLICSDPLLIEINKN